jgi:uncharacterized membrane protein YtjA (UPF0391 family)
MPAVVRKPPLFYALASFVLVNVNLRQVLLKHRAGANVAAFLCRGDLMLYWAVVFLIIALVAAVFGFGGIAVAAAGIAKFLFFLFVVIFLIMLVLGLRGRRSV